jgi:hypothetical protein
MDKFKAWLAAHKITAHSLVAVWVFLTGLFASNPAFKSYVLSLYGKTPAFLHEFVAGVIVPAIIYYRSQKQS